MPRHSKSASYTNDVSMYRSWGKRSIDIAGSIVALILLSPLLAVAAAAVKLGDSGPVFFVQTRVGTSGTPFPCLKLRSMPVDTPQEASSSAATLTITPVGRVLRRTNIDELPQLVNIAAGHMSLVGPRPALPSQHELLELRRSSGASKLRPGLTGLAQIRAHDDMPVAEKAMWDEVYVTKLSLSLDTVIVARSFLYLLKPPPRY